MASRRKFPNVGTVPNRFGTSLQARAWLAQRRKRPAPTYNLNTGLVHYWTLNNTYADAVGGGPSIVSHGSPLFDLAGKVYPQAVHLNGSTQYGSIAVGSIESESSALTVAVWFFFLNTTNAFLAAKWNSNTVVGEWAMLVADGIAFRRGTPSIYAEANLSTTFSVSQWYLGWGSYDPITDRVSSALNASAETFMSATGVTPSASDLFVGSDSGLGQFFTGVIGPVAIWNRVLSQDEREFYFNFGSGRAYNNLVTT